MKYLRINLKWFGRFEAKKLWVEAGQPRKKKLFNAKYEGRYPDLPWRCGKWVLPMTTNGLAETTDRKYWAAPGAVSGWYIFKK